VSRAFFLGGGVSLIPPRDSRRLRFSCIAGMERSLTILQLSPDVLGQILSYVRILQSLLALRLVCKTFRSVLGTILYLIHLFFFPFFIFKQTQRMHLSVLRYRTSFAERSDSKTSNGSCLSSLQLESLFSQAAAGSTAPSMKWCVDVQHLPCRLRRLC
jgi:hypothetical protein